MRQLSRQLSKNLSIKQETSKELTTTSHSENFIISVAFTLCVVSSFVGMVFVGIGATTPSGYTIAGFHNVTGKDATAMRHNFFVAVGLFAAGGICCAICVATSFVLHARKQLNKSKLMDEDYDDDEVQNEDEYIDFDKGSSNLEKTAIKGIQEPEAKELEELEQTLDPETLKIETSSSTFALLPTRKFLEAEENSSSGFLNSEQIVSDFSEILQSGVDQTGIVFDRVFIGNPTGDDENEGFDRKRSVDDDALFWGFN